MTFCQTYRSDGIKHRLEPSGREMNEHDHPVETILHESTKKNEIRTNRILTEQRVVCTKQSRAQRTAEKVISKPFRRLSTMEKCKSHQSDLMQQTPLPPNPHTCLNRTSLPQLARPNCPQHHRKRTTRQDSGQHPEHAHLRRQHILASQKS